MSKTAAIPMDKEIQSFLFTFTGQQYKVFNPILRISDKSDLSDLSEFSDKSD